MLTLLKIFIIVLLLDSIYLNVISQYFMTLVKTVQGSELQINYTGAIFCYCFIVFMIYYFIIKEKKSINDAFILGMSTYAIFEFTNMAIFNNWLSFVIYIDIVWGGLLYALTTYIIQNNYI